MSVVLTPGIVVLEFAVELLAPPPLLLVSFVTVPFDKSALVELPSPAPVVVPVALSSVDVAVLFVVDNVELSFSPPESVVVVLAAELDSVELATVVLCFSSTVGIVVLLVVVAFVALSASSRKRALVSGVTTTEASEAPEDSVVDCV